MATKPKRSTKKNVAKAGAAAKPQAKKTAKPKATAKKPSAPRKPARKAVTVYEDDLPVTRKAAPAAATRAVSHPLRNSNFPSTYIKEISVSLDDPDHWVKLTWTGPKAAGQETGPFRGSPGAGSKGLNCDLVATSRRSGSHCTPKGTHYVASFARRLNSDSRAEYATFFVQSRGIALHYFPSVPKYAASHGCVRIEAKRAAQLIWDNSRIDKTKVIVGGTWTKPPKQW